MYDLRKLNTIRIPRWINIQSYSQKLKLFGFSDGSEKGYRTVIYLLNPCSAELNKLIFLSSHTNCFIRLKNLSWLAGDPYSWKPYVANRTTKILKHIESCRWFYIESGMNPADYASKGFTPSEILDANLWWNGPDLNQLPPQVELVLDEEQTALIEKEIKKDTSVFFQSLSNPEIILTKAQIIINSYEAYKSRCKIQLKAYIAVFVCLYSKCMHIEIVYDLSSDCFLAAFKRFTNRRGRCKRLYSDNGTNFKGADKIQQSDILNAELTWKLDLDATLKEYDTE